MLSFKGVGFVAALIYNFFTSFKLLKELLLRYAWPYIPFLAKRPDDKFAYAGAMVMMQVSLALLLSPFLSVPLLLSHRRSSSSFLLLFVALPVLPRHSVVQPG